MKAIFLFPLVLILFLSAAVLGQEPTDPPKTDVAQPGQNERPNLFAALGLSPEQVEQIRLLNQERRPRMQEAQRRLRESVRNLDMAIYSDAVNDVDFAARLREHQEAQAEVAKLRFEGELAIRKVLMPDQLVKFRQMRRRFNEARQKFRQERKFQDRQPGARPLNGLRPKRPLQ